MGRHDQPKPKPDPRTDGGPHRGPIPERQPGKHEKPSDPPPRKPDKK